MRKLALVVLIGLVVLAAAVIGLNRISQRDIAFPPVPIPNGYDELVSAARDLAPIPNDLEALEPDRIRELAEANRPVLERVRIALTNECRVPLQAGMNWPGTHLPELAALKQLMRVLQVEVRALDLEGKTNEILQCHLDGLRLATASARGGLMIDALVGLALERVATADLEKRLSNLSSQQCRQVAPALEQFDAQRDSWEQTLDYERRWVAQSYTGLQGLSVSFLNLLAPKFLQDARTKFSQRHQSTVRSTRRLRLHLAARAFELETGRRPGKSSDLIPQYLKTVPIDPQTGGPMEEIPHFTVPTIQ